MKNKLTLKDIESKITNKTFTRLPSQKSLICELTLINGFTVRGEASVVDIDNYEQEVGEKISYENAIHKIWQVEGYLLQEKLYNN